MPDSRKAKILIVDDREDGLVALEAALEHPRYTLVRAGSGQDALKQVLEHDFAAIVLDVQMPDMDGFTTAEYIRMRQRSRHVPIIFVTAINKDDQYVFRGYEMGAVDYIFKPFDSYVLQSKIRVFVDLFEKTREIERQAQLLRENERFMREQEMARREVEALLSYRSLAEAVPDIVCRADVDGKMVFFNKRWEDFTGLSAEESLGDAWMSRVEPSDLERLRTLFNIGMAKKAPFESEARLRGRTGEERWFLIRAVPEFGPEREFKGWVGTKTDIHDRKVAESELRQAKLAAEAANRTKSAFLANMSHEIRTPLGAILGFAELLTTPEVSRAERTHCWNAISRNGQQLSRIIDEILDLSKVESGKFEVERSECSVAEMVNDINVILSAKANDKGIVFKTSFEGDVPRFIHTDLVRLKQIFINVIGNAIKFTEAGAVTAQFSVKDGGTGKPPLFAVHVADTGIGIADEAKARLFQPFVQADSSMRRKFGGTGLGLALSRQMANILGGDVSLLKSAPGVGSEFLITVSTGLDGAFEVLEQEGDFKPSDSGSAAEEMANNPLSGLKILVVDDAEDNQVLISRFLKLAGAAVECAGNGQEGVQQATGGGFDVVLMDVQMPVLDGYEATRTLRTSGFKKPIIALTAHAMKDEREKCLAVGCDHFLTKPLQWTDLISTLARYKPRPAPRNATIH